MAVDYVVPDELLARCVGKPELVKRVVGAFVRQIEGDILQLAADLDVGDFPGVEKTAHRIKGAAANVAADRICADAELIEETACRRDAVGNASALEQLKNDWQCYLDLTSGFLEQCSLDK